MPQLRSISWASSVVLQQRVIWFSYSQVGKILKLPPKEILLCFRLQDSSLYVAINSVCVIYITIYRALAKYFLLDRTKTLHIRPGISRQMRRRQRQHSLLCIFLTQWSTINLEYEVSSWPQLKSHAEGVLLKEALLLLTGNRCWWGSNSALKDLHGKRKTSVSSSLETVMFPNKHVKIQRAVYPQEQLTTDYACNQSSTQMEILH